MPTFDAGQTGLVGTVGCTILDSAGAEHVARTTAGITELVAGSGVCFIVEHDAAATLTYVWDIGVGTIAASETLYAGRGDLAAMNAACDSAISDAALATEDAATVNVETVTDAIAAAAPVVDFTDVLDAIAALPDDTDVADVLAALALVKLKTDTIGAAAVTVVSPVAACGTITVNAGDDYAAADGRAITFTVPVADVPDLTGAVVKLKCTQATWTAATCTSDGTNWTITFTPTKTQTAALTIGHQDYELEAVLATNLRVVTIATGTLVSERDIPATTP